MKRKWIRAGVAAMVAALVAGCPMPFQYSKEGWAGNASEADPSTPQLTASPVLVYSSSAGAGGTIGDGESATTSSDTAITLQSDTAGSVIYYTIDGTTPDPRAPQTKRYLPGSPITLAIASPTVDASTASLAIKAAAIGPNMKPSAVMSATVNVQYPQAEPPSFSLPDPVYTVDQDLVLTTATAGAQMYYTMAPGSGPAPRPVPGQAGTSPYTGPILVAGPSNTWTFAAIAVKDKMIDSRTATATYTVACRVAPPNFSHAGGNYPGSITVTLSDATTGAVIHYTTGGSTPSAASPIYSTPLAIPSGTTIVRALATRPGYADSQEVSATYVIPAAPTGLAVKGAWVTCIFASWNAVPGAIHYTLLRDTSPSFPSPVYLYPSTNSYTDTGLSGQTAYYYKVRAVYASGDGDFSAAATGTVLLPAQVPALQHVSTNGLAKPTVMPVGAPADDYWVGANQTGWTTGNGYTYVVWDPDYENWGSFAIAAYDPSDNFAGQWLFAGNRYITSITLDGTGNILIVGQYGTTVVPWHTIMLP